MKSLLIKKLGLKKESKPTAGSGNFQKVSGAIQKSEIAAGKSPAEAKRIWGATSAIMGRKKYGAKPMAKAAAKGRLIALMASKK